ncbi:MAG: hypothetical protein NWE98_10145 [Candidatus Bathyarchaeota archaeon]|nr:hypothetical protein [Candidatus Bathyarchaeota archaeon]
MNQKEYMDKTISKIDQSQLPNSANDVNVRDEYAKDMRPDEFTGGLDAPSDGSTGFNPEFPAYPETQRFAKKHDIPESAKVTGQKSSGLKGE